MDRNTRRLCRALLIFFALAALGCRPKVIIEPIDPVKVAQQAMCRAVTPSPENCAFAGDVFMFIIVVAKPTHAKKDNRNPNVMSGTCEMQTRSRTEFCADVRLSVFNSELVGENGRTEPMGAKETILGGLPKGSYSVSATSELHKVSVLLNDIPSGSAIKVVLRKPVIYQP